MTAVPLPATSRAMPTAAGIERSLCPRGLVPTAGTHAGAHAVTERIITLAQYFMGRDGEHGAELTGLHRHNARIMVARANALLQRACIACAVSSGWRPHAINATVPNASPRSRHLTCEAIDLADPDDRLDAWCLRHLDVLSEIGLWLEHPEATPGWCHVQIVPPRSGRRVFRP